MSISKITAKKHGNSVLKFLLCLTAAAAGILILINPSEISSAVSAAVGDCLEVIIPSLFAFTALSVYLQKSGLYRAVLKPLTFPLSKLLRLDEELCAVIILGNIGGYPVGIKLLHSLVSSGRLDREGASRLLCCCYGSGPSFVIGIAGMRVFGSAAAGGVLFASCFLSSLVIAAFVRFKGNIALKPGNSGVSLDAECFISSVESAAKVMFTVCVMITGFAVINRLLELTGVFSFPENLLRLLGMGENAGAAVRAVFEVSRLKALTPYAWVMPLCAALLSFGGICVLMQVQALSGGIPLGRFVLSRIPASIMSALFTVPAALLYERTAETLAPGFRSEPSSVNAIASAGVLIMSGILLSQRKRTEG